jgi:glutamyl-tRNA reductase
VVLASTGSPDVLLDAARVESVMAFRPDRPLLIVDIAVPRDVDPAVGRLPGVRLHDMDDLSEYARRGMAGRRQEVPKAEAIVEDELGRYSELAAERQVAPLVSALHERAEAVRRAELDRYQRRLGSLDDHQVQTVEALTRAIVAKLLHDPTVALKSAAGTPVGDQLSSALQQLYQL